jgi:hypothetical protein
MLGYGEKTQSWTTFGIATATALFLNIPTHMGIAWATEKCCPCLGKKGDAKSGAGPNLTSLAIATPASESA